MKLRIPFSSRMVQYSHTMSPQEIAEQLEIFEHYLKKNGLKMTRQREIVVETFLQTGGHMSTDELYDLVRARDKKIGFATVFRTLKALTDCRLATETHLSDGRTRFEHFYKRPHHHHIVCIECNRAIEFFSPELEQLQEKLVAEYKFRSIYRQLQIFGVCPDCENQRKPAAQAFDSDLIFARDALKIAMETEKRGVSFYTATSESLSDTSTKSTFLKMLDEEREHLSELEQEWDRLFKKNKRVLDAPVFLHFDYEALKQIFPSREKVQKMLKGSIAELDALKIAMEMEKEAYIFFRDYAEKFSDSRGRDIFLKFAEQEQEHYNSIKTEYDRLIRETG